MITRSRRFQIFRANLALELRSRIGVFVRLHTFKAFTLATLLAIPTLGWSMTAFNRGMGEW